VLVSAMKSESSVGSDAMEEKKTEAVPALGVSLDLKSIPTDPGADLSQDWLSSASDCTGKWSGLWSDAATCFLVDEHLLAMSKRVLQQGKQEADEAEDTPASSPSKHDADPGDVNAMAGDFRIDWAAA